MSEKEFERIIKSIERDVVPPQGLKEEMLLKVLMQENSTGNPDMTKIDRLIFEKPLRAACVLSILISGILWAVMGNGYTNILNNVLGIR